MKIVSIQLTKDSIIYAIDNGDNVHKIDLNEQVSIYKELNEYEYLKSSIKFTESKIIIATKNEDIILDVNEFEIVKSDELLKYLEINKEKISLKYFLKLRKNAENSYEFKYGKVFSK